MSWIKPWLDLLPQPADPLIGGLLFLDAETQCRADLKKVGAPAYARALREETTPVLCWAYWRPTKDKDVQLWTPGQSLDWLLKHQGRFVAHNIEFESWVIRELYSLDIQPERWLDTAALGRHWSFPGHLADATGEKDMEGHRIMLKLSKPRRPSKDNPDLFWTPQTKPKEFQGLYEYCRQDIRATARFMNRELAPPLADEKAVMDLTTRMNRRGIPIDISALKIAQKLARADRARISDELKALTGCTAQQTVALAAHLGVPSLAKDKLRDMLRDPMIPEDMRHILRLRQEFAKSSVAKIGAFLARAVDGRIHDGLIYGGAERSLRWTGAGIQPQNIPRGGGAATLPLFEQLLSTGTLPDFYVSDDGDTISGTQDIIKSMLRGFITGPLLVGDFAQIEARLLAWYAGDEVLLDAFATGKDPYRIKASEIYGKPVDQITKPERFLGKQTTLGAGYGLGYRGFRAMLAVNYDVHIEEEEAFRIVQGYRRTTPKVVNFWDRIERSLAHARKTQKGTWIDKDKGLLVRWTSSDCFFIQLPSGRRITYRQVERDTYYGRLKNGAGYGPIKFYGGMLTGHIVQSTARDLMANALLNLDAARFNLVLTVHDEAVPLDPPSRLEEFESIMRQTPPWAEGLPVDVDCFASERYRK